MTCILDPKRLIVVENASKECSEFYEKSFFIGFVWLRYDKQKIHLDWILVADVSNHHSTLNVQSLSHLILDQSM